MKNSNYSYDIRNRVNSYFDNELGENERDELLSMVNQDPKCNKIFNKEKNFREYIKSNVKRPPVSSDLIQSIRDKIRVI